MSNEADLEAARALLEAYRARADTRLAEILDAEVEAAKALPFQTARYLALLHDYALRGGKRLRGALVLVGYEAAAGEDGPEREGKAFEASLAFELLHASLLACDDWMDRDELRRGGPALHVAAAAEAKRRRSADAAHRGASIAILLGMLAHQEAFRCLERAQASLTARAYFDQVTRDVVIGQLLDVTASDAARASSAEVREIERLKTGVYTTEGPLVFGALLAGAHLEGEVVAALRAFAGPLGEAYQLVDDLLGAVGDPRDTGKPAGRDLEEGKHTAVVEEAVRRLPAEARARLLALIGRPLDPAEAREATSLLVESGAGAAVRARARELAACARRTLGPPLEAAAAGKLGWLASLVAERHN